MSDDPYSVLDDLQATLQGDSHGFTSHDMNLIRDALAVLLMSSPNVEKALSEDRMDKFVATVADRHFKASDLIRLLRKAPRLNQLGIRVVLAALATEKRRRGRPQKGASPVLSQSKREMALQHYRVIAEAVGRQAMYGQKEDLLKSIAKEYRVSVDQLRDDVRRKVAKK